MKPEEMTRSERIIELDNEIRDIGGVNPDFIAECEAEHYCSKLSMLNLVDGVISEDTDTLACGSKLIIRQFSNQHQITHIHTASMSKLCFNIHCFTITKMFL